MVESRELPCPFDTRAYQMLSHPYVVLSMPASTMLSSPPGVVRNLFPHRKPTIGVRVHINCQSVSLLGTVSARLLSYIFLLYSLT
jgi:hypothetical protein